MSSTIEIPSYAKPSDEERAALPALLARELAWNASSPRFQTEQDIKTAIAQGILREFTGAADIARIRRFESPAPGKSPYLTGVAHGVARIFGSEWRETLKTEYGLVLPHVRLAMTSMVRSHEYQDSIVAAGRLAVPNSTHCTGNTFDIDASGYYEVDEHGELHPVIDPRRRVEVDGQLPNYDPRVTAAALQAAHALHETDTLNLVPEFSGSPNACLHIAANPHY